MRSKLEQQVEAFVLTLNEEANIAACLQSIRRVGVTRITVLDGGSYDNTVATAADLSRIKQMNGTSIAQRRHHAVLTAEADFLLFVDADQLLPPETDLSEIIAKYFGNPQVAGVQFSLGLNHGSGNYWERGFHMRHQLLDENPGPRVVIGTPCVWRQSAVSHVNYDASISGPSDDTALGWRLADAGFTSLKISEPAMEKVRASFRQTLRKAFWYGRGDAEFIRCYPALGRSHAFHVLLRGPLGLMRHSLVRQPTLTPFALIFGAARIVGLAAGTLSRGDLTTTAS